MLSVIVEHIKDLRRTKPQHYWVDLNASLLENELSPADVEELLRRMEAYCEGRAESKMSPGELPELTVMQFMEFCEKYIFAVEKPAKPNSKKLFGIF